MEYLLKLGPVVLEAQRMNVYLRVGDDGSVAPPVFGAADADAGAEVEALKSLLSTEAEVHCAPELIDAAGVLGLPVSPVPPAVARSLAAIAVFMAWGQRGISELGSELALAAVEAATEFWTARPWRFWRENQPLQVETTGTSQRQYEAALLGNSFQGYGVALYPNEGDVQRLAELQAAGQFDEAKKLSGVALMLDDKPGYAVTALERAQMAPRVPVLLRTSKTGLGLPTAAEALTLVGALRAVAQLSSSVREAAVDCRLADDALRVVVVAPAPVMLQ